MVMVKAARAATAARRDGAVWRGLGAAPIRLVRSIAVSSDNWARAQAASRIASLLQWLLHTIHDFAN
jgi:hypothetical protein